LGLPGLVRFVASSFLSGLFRYGESELDPVVQAEILLESARNEARVAMLEVLLALCFGLFYFFQGEPFTAVAIFALATVVPLLVDAQLRRSAARRLLARGPVGNGRAKRA
jgi:hypothetical protein